ncbi:MAG: hypothetical protein ABEI52_08945, partial [Halobacteriaceae archaeon]
RVSKQKIGRNYRQFSHELDLTMNQVSPTDYLPRYMNDLDESYETKQIARSILKVVEEEGILSEREPTTLVAAAVYLAGLLSGDWLHQEDVSAATGVGVPTISKTYQDLLDELTSISQIEMKLCHNLID